MKLLISPRTAFIVLVAKCGEAFQAADVDLVFCHLTTYATFEPLVLVVRELNVPVVFLNVQSVKALDVYGRPS